MRAVECLAQVALAAISAPQRRTTAAAPPPRAAKAAAPPTYAAKAAAWQSEFFEADSELEALMFDSDYD
jgi:hypothetical protein